MGNKNIFNVIGLMSGTSLDGLDIAFCRFEKTAANWIYEIIASDTIKYSQEWKNKLANLQQQSALELAETDIALATYFGNQINIFLNKYQLNPDFISSHGHTIFHQPQKGITWQIANGGVIAAISGITTVCDFRIQDVTLGGQGAPLVPIGDALLFKEFDFCLNLGGIANISFETDGKRIASDICFCNMALNYLAQKSGFEYDKNGDLAAVGKVNDSLLLKLNSLPFSDKLFPKSLGKENFDLEIIPLFESEMLSNQDCLATFVEHISIQLKIIIEQTNIKNGKMLITGGGALNSFLMEQIKRHLSCEVIVPDRKIIEFKEALIFAFLGVLRIRNEVNTLSSVTGASRNLISGGVYYG